MSTIDTQRGVVFTGGEAPGAPPQGVVLEGAFIVAADSGMETALSWGVEPELVLGDMDSLSDMSILDRFEEGQVRRYAREKDYTDTELALAELYDRGIEDITLVGGGGGRLDHLLGIVALFDRDKHPTRWYTRNEHVECIDRELALTGAEGETVSLFPAGRDRCRMRSEGLRWPLDSLSWIKGDAGISNVVVSEECRILVIQGRLIMVRSLPPGSP
ncbi:MAG: thiamine diphosphokinase [Spirochaetaceae bacterium]